MKPGTGPRELIRGLSVNELLCGLQLSDNGLTLRPSQESKLFLLKVPLEYYAQSNGTLRRSEYDGYKKLLEMHYPKCRFIAATAVGHTQDSMAACVLVDVQSVVVENRLRYAVLVNYELAYETITFASPEVNSLNPKKLHKAKAELIVRMLAEIYDLTMPTIRKYVNHGISADHVIRHPTSYISNPEASALIAGESTPYMKIVEEQLQKIVSHIIYNDFCCFYD
jgi:hypothetical protein